MPSFIDPAWLQSLGDLAAKGLLANVLGHFFVFTLVAARLGGMVVSAPVFSHTQIPINVRIFSVASLALCITPLLPIAVTRFGEIVPLPHSLLDYAWIALTEFGIGYVLGWGVATVLSGLQLAGQLIDQQTGLGLAEVFNPELDISGSLTGQTLFLFGTTLFLVLGGHLLLFSAVIETFQSLPLGRGWVSQGVVDLLVKLVHQSLVLSLQVAAPLLATLSLLTVTVGFLGRSVPQLGMQAFSLPLRVMLGLFVLALALSGTGEAIADVLPRTVSQLREALSG
jgi:flagellar biosynthesis protein FliR